jgi:hypothetical protein
MPRRSFPAAVPIVSSVSILLIDQDEMAMEEVRAVIEEAHERGRRCR